MLITLKKYLKINLVLKLTTYIFVIINYKLIMENKNKLVRISTYAKSIGKTTVWVGTLIKEGKLQTEIIDGTVFIKI